MTKRERNNLIYARHEEEYSQEDIGKFYGLSQSRVSAIILSIKNGTADLEKKKRGVKSRLDGADLEKLKLLLEIKEEKEAFYIWNKWSIKKLIKENFGSGLPSELHMENHGKDWLFQSVTVNKGLSQGSGKRIVFQEE